jgi:hypothetical protein
MFLCITDFIGICFCITDFIGINKTIYRNLSFEYVIACLLNLAVTGHTLLSVIMTLGFSGLRPFSRRGLKWGGNIVGVRVGSSTGPVDAQWHWDMVNRQRSAPNGQFLPEHVHVQGICTGCQVGH